MAMVARYWDDLNDRDATVLAETLNNAWREFPTFFPSLGELSELYSKTAKRVSMNSTVKQLPESTPFSDGDAAERARKILTELNQRMGA